MWRLLKRLFGSEAASAPAADDREMIRIDAQGFHRSTPATRSMRWREEWSWDEIDGFGFSFKPALFPDPWFGDYMESEWFFIVSSGSGPEKIHFDVTWLDIDRLPAALVENMPDIDLGKLRTGLATAARGPQHYEGEGEWLAWSRPKRRRKKAAAAKKPRQTRTKRAG